MLLVWCSVWSKPERLPLVGVASLTLWRSGDCVSCSSALGSAVLGGSRGENSNCHACIDDGTVSKGDSYTVLEILQWGVSNDTNPTLLVAVRAKAPFACYWPPIGSFWHARSPSWACGRPLAGAFINTHHQKHRVGLWTFCNGTDTWLENHTNLFSCKVQKVHYCIQNSVHKI